MRKHKLLISAIAALAVCVGSAAVAQAVITGTGITVSSTKAKQFKKQHGPIDLSITTENFETPPTPNGQTPSVTSVDFDKDIKFTPGKLGVCTQAQLQATTTETARARCPTAVVGTGVAKSCSATAGCTAVEHQLDVTAFNGAPEGGTQILFLHVKGVGAIAALPAIIVKGRLINSPLAGQGYGKRLVIPDQPDTGSTGNHLITFDLDTPVLKNGLKKKVKGPKNPNTGKRKIKKVPQYFAMAKCSDKQWQFRVETSFRAGGGTHAGTQTIPCQQKAAKKKGK